MNHWYTKLLLSFVIATAVVANTYDVPLLEEFGDETQLLAAGIPPIQPGLTLPPAPEPMMPPIVEQPPIMDIAPMSIEVHPAPSIMPPVDMAPTPTPPISISTPPAPTSVPPAAPIPAPSVQTQAPVVTPPAHPDTPMMAQPAEHHEKPKFPAPQQSVTSEPKVEVAKHHESTQEKESDERIKLLTEQLAQVQEKLTALESHLKSIEQKAHKTDSQLTALINELEAPAPQDDEEPMVGSAPNMESPAHEKKAADIPLFGDDDEEEADEAGRKL